MDETMTATANARLGNQLRTCDLLSGKQDWTIESVKRIGVNFPDLMLRARPKSRL
jgi:hypothetical protein